MTTTVTPTNLATPSVFASTIKQLHPKEYLRRFLDHTVRTDARGFNESRSLTITNDGITTAEGSALVKLGDTAVLCVVKAEVAIPHHEAPDRGYLVPNVELPPLCSSQFKPGPPSPLAQSMSQFLARLHAKTPLIDLHHLCIDPGNAVWTLYADIYCLSYHGNVLDAACMALVSALHSVRLPRAIYTDGCVRASRHRTQPLRLLHVPITCTFALVDRHVLSDPTEDEETHQAGQLTVTLDMRTDKVLGIHHVGAPVDTEKVRAAVGVARERVRVVAGVVEGGVGGVDGREG